MIYGFYFARLSIRSQGTAVPQFHESTIELPAVDIFATTAITGVSLGTLDGAPGMTNAYIKKYGRIATGGSEEHLSPPASDVFFNSVYVPQCTYVNFRLSAVQAESGMQGTIWVMSPTESDSPDRSRKSMNFDFVDDHGQALGSHEYSILTSNSRLDVPGQVESLRKALASEHNLAAESIAIKLRESCDDSKVQWVGQ